jgi:hypothetical protein
MGMTYLQLCQRARQEAGIAGSGPSAVTGQSGKLLKLVDWVSQAWTDIQLKRPNWNFMWSSFSFDTIASQRDYLASGLASPITDLSLWDRDSFLIYKTSLDANDQNELVYLEYPRWRDGYRARMEVRAEDRPQMFTILPNNQIRFEPVSDVPYTIDGEYKRTAQVLAADADVLTNFPDDFQLIVVWQALKYYAFFEDAPEVLDEAETMFDNLLVRLEAEQLPTMSEAYKGLA